RPATVQAFCKVAAELGLIIISDEIYRDLVHDPATPVLSPAAVAPQRTVVTTALSKSFALGGWRIGVARLPEGSLGSWLQGQLVRVGAGGADPAGRGAGLPRAPGTFRAHRAEPVAARRRLPRGGGHLPRRRPPGSGPAGRVLRLPGLRAVARAPGPPPRRD